MLRLFKGGAVSLHACTERRQELKGEKEEEKEETCWVFRNSKNRTGFEIKKTLLNGASESCTLAGM
jgi:hypothetical protein